MVNNTVNENCRRISYVDELPAEEHFHVSNGEKLQINIALFASNINSKIVVDVDEEGVFEGAFADFSKENGTFSIEVNLNGRHSSCSWHLASLGSNECKKTYITSANHNVGETSALMSNYGISRDGANVIFSGTSHVKHDSKKSDTRQDAKIIVFDKESDGKAMPILKIDDNDIAASHAAIVGRLNEQHLFYLESRGISETNAKRLIALGYLKPIEEYFDDEIKALIDNAIEGGI